ncbi:hypothetical protein HanRHA438_Chr14g0672951 [Helianthus annuus]|nr:hypothetical protein HanRHA438_Chr14g0672951 [Helianthus annuus]
MFTRMLASRLKNHEQTHPKMPARLLLASSSSKHADPNSSLARMALPPCFTGSTQLKSLCAKAAVLRISAPSTQEASPSLVL